MIEVKEFTGGINGLPQFQDRKQMWDTLSFGLVKDKYPQTHVYINALREVFDNGAVEFRAFSVPENEVFDWYASRNQFHEMGFFKQFWCSPTVKQEFPYPHADARCRLWFLENGLPGYAWYVPKAGGIVNVGIGGKVAELRAQGDRLKRHWALLVANIEKPWGFRLQAKHTL